MILSHPVFDSSIDLARNNLVVLEHPLLYRTLVAELIAQSEGETGRFLLTENYEEKSIGKCLSIIHNPFQLCENDHKMRTALYKLLETEVQTLDFEYYKEVESKIIQFLQHYAILISAYDVGFYRHDRDLQTGAIATGIDQRLRAGASL